MGRLLAILVVVLVLLGGLFATQQMGEHSGAPEMQALVTLDSAAVQRFEVTRDGTTTVIERQDGGWRISRPIDVPADADMVNSALTMLTHLQSNGVISTNPDKAERFQVDAEHGIVVAFYSDENGKPLARYTVGKLAPGFTHTYVSLAGSHEVHRVNGPIRFQVQKDVASWRDRSVLRFDPASVSRLVISGSKGVALTRTDDGWALADGHGVVPNEVLTPILGYLSKLRAVTFDDAPTDLTGDPLLTISIWRKGEDNPIDLVVEMSEAAGYRVVTDANPQRYVVVGDRLKELVDDPQAALGLPLPEADLKSEENPKK